MPGRRAIPLSLHKANGNKSHLTAAEIRDREENEIHFGTFDFKPTRRLKKNKIALKKWRETIDLYTSGNVDFVTTSDAGLLERYCLTFAEYYTLQEVRDEIEAKGWDRVKTYHAISELGLETDINKKLDALTKMEDRLFLNPLAKIRNVPKTESKKIIDQGESEMFGG
jgi:phage terminase small subunit